MVPLIFSSKGYHWFERMVVATLGLMVAISIVLTLAQAAVAQERTIRWGHLQNKDHPVSAGAKRSLAAGEA